MSAHDSIMITRFLLMIVEMRGIKFIFYKSKIKDNDCECEKINKLIFTVGEGPAVVWLRRVFAKYF